MSGFFLYSLQASFSYSETIKNSNYGLIASLAISNIAGSVWFYVAKTTTNPRDILTYGTIWDSFIMLSYWIVPIAFFGVKLNPASIFGLSIVAVGTLIVKLNG
jgi:hypothetical protein